MQYVSEIDFVFMPVINFAMHQNHVQVVKKLSARNITENDLENVIITIQSDPEFAVTFEYSIDIIRKDEIFELSSVGSFGIQTAFYLVKILSHQFTKTQTKHEEENSFSCYVHKELLQSRGY